MKPIFNTQAFAKAVANFKAAATRELLPHFAATNAYIAKLNVALTAPASTPIDARPAHCGNIMTLLAHLCDMDDELRLWVLRWLAFPLRNPGARMSTALVFNGSEDSGKSLFMNFVVAEIYGDSAAKIRPRDLHRTFNRWIEGRSLAVAHGWIEGANLAVVDGDFARSHIAKMKAAMTAQSFVVERKGEASRAVSNRLNFIYVTSSPDFLPADVGNRRFMVIEVPPRQQRAFYQAVVHEIAEGGVDAFRDYLMHGLDLGEFNEHTPPPVGTFIDDRRTA